MKKIIKKKIKKPKTKKSTDKKSINVNVHIDQSKKNNKSSSVKNVSKGGSSGGAPSILFQPPTPIFQQQPSFSLADIVNTIKTTVRDIKNEESGDTSYSSPMNSEYIKRQQAEEALHQARIDAIKKRTEEETQRRENMYDMVSPVDDTQSYLGEIVSSTLWSPNSNISEVENTNMENPQSTTESVFASPKKSNRQDDVIESKDEEDEGAREDVGTPSLTAEEIDALNTRELKKLARQLNITYSVQGQRLNKEELQTRIKGHLNIK